MICKYCGEEFETNARGKKKDYCNKPECIRQAKNEAQRKWYANKMQVLKGTKARIIEQKDEKKVVYVYFAREEPNPYLSLLYSPDSNAFDCRIVAYHLPVFSGIFQCGPLAEGVENLFCRKGSCRHFPVEDDLAVYKGHRPLQIFAVIVL